MAKLVVSILSSLDGYCAGPGGRLDDMPMVPAFDEHNRDLMRSAGTFLFGAVTFPMFEGYWPHVDRRASSDPIAREISERFEAGHRLVVSDRLSVAPTSPWAKTELVKRGRAHARICELKAEYKEDLLIFGSHILFNDLLMHGLVDELYLLVGNALLGEGVRTFEPGVKAPFRLMGQRCLPGSDIAALRYDCRPS